MSGRLAEWACVIPGTVAQCRTSLPFFRIPLWNDGQSDPGITQDYGQGRAMNFISTRIVIESEISSESDLEIRSLLCECFPADAGEFSQQRAWHNSIPAYSVIARDNGILVGQIGIVRREVRVGDCVLPVAGVQNFCVRKSHRGKGLSGDLMRIAMAEAAARAIPFGMLFCLPDLEKIYIPMGWTTIAAVVEMRDEHGNRTALPDKNITMVACLTSKRFPDGPIDLMGRDW
jgi:GNAT superfamily N-acetyltransferase